MDRGQREQGMIAAFCEITAASTDSGRFFLESANWNLELAIENFLEAFGPANIVHQLPADAAPREFGHGDAPLVIPELFPEELGEAAEDQEQPPVEQIGQQEDVELVHEGGGDVGDEQHVEEEPAEEEVAGELEEESIQGENRDQDVIEGEEAARMQEVAGERDSGNLPCRTNEQEVVEPSASSHVARSRVVTMSTLRAQDSSSDEEEGQAYYAGGSEHSGQQVVGPSRSSQEIIEEIFRSLREQSSSDNAIGNEPGTARRFVGHGYRLGQSSDESQVVRQGEQSHAEHARDVVLQMWRNGFTIDDGDLRSYSDPQERDFLSRIRRGDVPAEFFPEIEGGAILNLSLEDHRDEDYVSCSNKRRQAFSGEGHVLGSQSDPAPQESVPAIVGRPSRVEAVESSVDRDKPSTTIQIRLPDGDRLQITLNASSTVAELREAIIAQRNELRSNSFTLTVSYPRRVITDHDQTLQDADILGSSLSLTQ